VGALTGISHPPGGRVSKRDEHIRPRAFAPTRMARCRSSAVHTYGFAGSGRNPGIPRYLYGLVVTNWGLNFRVEAPQCCIERCSVRARLGLFLLKRRFVILAWFLEPAPM